MALTTLQREICRLIASARKEGGESYVAGGTALNALLNASRVSRDIGLFHDTEEALRKTWDSDRACLEKAGFELEVLHERPSYVEALVGRGTEKVLVQWTRDSAYRFFPLVEHELFGLVLHPFDLATNKVLALAGRLEARDWIDVIECHEKVQRLGYLAWAACGKDPGFSPAALLAEAARASRYPAEEIQALTFEGTVPDAAGLSRAWRAMLVEAKTLVDRLPAEEAGRCVITKEGELFAGGPAELERALESGKLRFHSGSIKGAFPRVVPS